MNLEEYTPKALAFCKFLGTPQLDLAHAALLLTTEAIELVKAEFTGIAEDDTDAASEIGLNIIEEVGDLMWSLNLLAFLKGTNLTDILTEDLSAYAMTMTIAHRMDADDTVITILQACGDVADMIKKELVYGKVFEPGDYELKVAALMGLLEGYLKVALESDDGEETAFFLSQALDANIAKLTKRFGSVYSDANALNRDTAAEYAAIARAGAREAEAAIA